MKYLDEKSLYSVLSNYPYEINEIELNRHKENRSVWWVRTDRGSKILKKLPYDIERTEFTLDCIKYLRLNNVNLPKIYKTYDKKSYVTLDDNIYILMSEIKGNKPKFNKETNLEDSVRELAKFHRVSSGFLPKNKEIIYNPIKEYTLKYAKHRKMLENFLNKIKDENSNTDFEKIAIKELPFFLNSTKEIEKQLEKSYYSSWCEKVSKYGGLGHFDFANYNLILTPKDELYIIDLDNIGIALPIWDIRMLLYDIMKNRKKFTKNNLEKILSLYQGINPLTADEWFVTKLNLLYPHKIFQLVRIYSNREKNWSEERFIIRLQETIKQEKLMAQHLKDFDSIIKGITG